MVDKFIVVQTARKQFRVFEVRGAWWGLCHTYCTRPRAVLCAQLLADGKRLAGLGRGEHREHPKRLGHHEAGVAGLS